MANAHGSTTAPSFPTAPRWLRPILRAERAALTRLYRGQRARGLAELEADGVEGSLNKQLTLLGRPAAERLVPGEVRGWVFAHHVSRYVWAMPRVDGAAVVELGSGPGYGSDLLSWTAASVTGLDIDPAAVARAEERYKAPTFICRDVTGDLSDLGRVDVIVCFEVIEHVEDPRLLLRQALKLAPRLLLSMPNPLIGGSHINPFHVNDWSPTTLWRALHAAGARRVRFFRQGIWSARVRRGAFPTSGVWLVDASR
jgi:2-polyprenyl-3-methyl-5-hydroxy-6-metoxy-1,4-benzoquinol methylase